MRILYLSYDGVLEPIGSSQIVAYLRALSRRGLRLTLISFEKAVMWRDAARRRAAAALLSQDGIRWYPLRYHKRCRVLATAWDMARGIVVGLYACRRFRVEAIHARSFVAAMMGMVLRALWRAKLIYDVRGFWSDELRANGRLREGLLCRLIRRGEQRLLATADQVVVLAEAAKAHLQTLGQSDLRKVTAIPCGVDPSFRYTQEGRAKVRAELGLTDKFVVLYAGSVENWYRMDRMLECFRTIQSLEPRAHLVILACSGASFVQSLAAQVGLGPEALTVTSAPHDAMPACMSAADLGLFFINTPPAVAGVSPVKLAEYLSCRVPVLSNAGIGDMDRLFASYQVGALIASYTPEAYARAAREIFRLKEEPERLRLACERAIRDELSIDVGVGRYADVYQRLSPAMERPGAPLVTVVIPTFNRARYLRAAIDSVLAQTYRHWELIVVDDGSTDDTRDIISSYVKDPRVRYMHQRRSERGAARNTGIRHAAGRHLAFMDSDDVWLPDHLAHCLRVAGQHPEAGVVFSGSYLMDAHSRIIGRQARRRAQGFALDEMVARFSAGGCNASSCLIKRDVLDAVGYFSEDWALSGSEDWELWARLAARTPLYATSAYTVKLRCHPGMSSVNAEQMAASMTRALDAVYGNVELAPCIQRHRRRAYSSLAAIIAIHYYAAGQMSTCRAYVGRAIAQYPASLLTNRSVIPTFMKSLLGSRISAAARRAKWGLHARWLLRGSQ